MKKKDNKEKDNKEKGNMKKEEQEVKKNPLHREYGVFSNVRFVLGNMLKAEKAFCYLIPIGVICEPCMTYLWNFLSKFIIDIITEGQDLQKLLYLMLGFVAVQITVTMLNTFYQSDTDYRYIAARFKIITMINRKAMKIDFEHLENPDVMDCYQKGKNAVNGNMVGIEGMMRRVGDMLTALSVIFVGILILGSMNPLIVAGMTALAIVNFLISNKANKVSKKTIWDPLAPWFRKQWYVDNTTTSFKEAKDIRMYGLQGWLLDKYKKLNVFRYESQKRNAKLWLAVSITSNIIWLFSQIFVYAWLIYLVVNKSVTVGNFSLYLVSSGTFFGYISSVLNQISDLLAKSREVDDFRSFLDFEGGDEGDRGKILPRQEKYEFVFENVSFKYPKAEKYALKGLNLTLKPGERLAVVGLNGAGKSTFIKLLLRLYEPTEGRILLNGVDIREYSKESYYAAFAPVFQQVELFAFPMAENVSMKAPKETDREKAKACLEQAGMKEKLESLPKGVDTELLKIIVDDGVDLSGGEKQKLALARALYKDAPVVVLDEPTAALDAHAEAKLYQNFDAMIGSKTAVYISHRLSSTQFCSNVAMFVDGEMIEYGTHKALLEQGGSYAEMFHIQAQYYVENEEGEVAEDESN